MFKLLKYLTKEVPLMPDTDFLQSLRGVQLMFTRFYNQLLNEQEITLPQYALLNVLMNFGNLSMTEASEKLYITKPAVTNLVDRLEASKYVKRVPDPNDRRVTHLEILPAGKKVAEKIQKAVFKVALNNIEPFTEAERKPIRKFYASMGQRLEEAVNEMRNSDKS